MLLGLFAPCFISFHQNIRNDYAPSLNNDKLIKGITWSQNYLIQMDFQGIKVSSRFRVLHDFSMNSILKWMYQYKSSLFRYNKVLYPYPRKLFWYIACFSQKQFFEKSCERNSIYRYTHIVFQLMSCFSQLCFATYNVFS